MGYGNDMAAVGREVGLVFLEVVHLTLDSGLKSACSVYIQIGTKTQKFKVDYCCEKRKSKSINL